MSLKSEYLAGWASLLDSAGEKIGYGDPNSNLVWKGYLSALVQKTDGFPDADESLTVEILASDLVDGALVIKPAYRDSILLRKDGDPVVLSQGANSKYYLFGASSDYLIYSVDKIVFLSGVYRLHCKRNRRPKVS